MSTVTNMWGEIIYHVPEEALKQEELPPARFVSSFDNAVDSRRRKSSVDERMATLRNAKKLLVKDKDPVSKLKDYYTQLATACKMGASKKFNLRINFSDMSPFITCNEGDLIPLPIAFYQTTGATGFDNKSLSIEMGHITTPQQIERIMLHVVCSTEFKDLTVRHNRYQFRFGEMHTNLIQQLITAILDSNSKRINYSWIAPLQEIVIKYELEWKAKKKKKTSKLFSKPSSKGIPDFGDRHISSFSDSLTPKLPKEVKKSHTLGLGQAKLEELSRKSSSYTQFIKSLEDEMEMERMRKNIIKAYPIETISSGINVASSTSYNTILDLGGVEPVKQPSIQDTEPEPKQGSTVILKEIEEDLNWLKEDESL